MKHSFFLIILIFIAISCTTVYDASKKSSGIEEGQGSVIRGNSDSTEYELIIIDMNFDTWYGINLHRASGYSNDYYQTWNRLGAMNWNNYYMSGRFSRIIESSVDYNSNINYGLEFNKKLYWYFKYIEERYGIRLLR